MELRHDLIMADSSLSMSHAPNSAGGSLSCMSGLRRGQRMGTGPARHRITHNLSPVDKRHRGAGTTYSSWHAAVPPCRALQFLSALPAQAAAQAYRPAVS